MLAVETALVEKKTVHKTTRKYNRCKNVFEIMKFTMQLILVLMKMGTHFMHTNSEYKSKSIDGTHNGA